MWSEITCSIPASNGLSSTVDCTFWSFCMSETYSPKKFSQVIYNENINIHLGLFCFFQGCAQVSLADFIPENVSVKWYNILSFRFMQPSSDITSTNSVAPPLTQLSNGNTDAAKEPYPAVNSRDEGESQDKQESEISVFIKQVASVKEESSDDSTIISSQTSTLTCNQGRKYEVPVKSSCLVLTLFMRNLCQRPWDWDCQILVTLFVISSRFFTCSKDKTLWMCGNRPPSMALCSD